MIATLSIQDNRNEYFPNILIHTDFSLPEAYIYLYSQKMCILMKVRMTIKVTLL